MELNIIREIEGDFKKANRLLFYPSMEDAETLNTEKPFVVLVFEQTYDGAPSYEILTEDYRNKKTLLVIFKKEKELDISIVCRETGDSINVNHLKYDQDQLQDFLAHYNALDDSTVAFKLGELSDHDNVEHGYTCGPDPYKYPTVLFYKCVFIDLEKLY